MHENFSQGPLQNGTGPEKKNLADVNFVRVLISDTDRDQNHTDSVTRLSEITCRPSHCKLTNLARVITKKRHRWEHSRDNVRSCIDKTNLAVIY